jgi:hypothetical protein
MTPEEINKKAYEKYPVKLFPDDDTLGFTSTDVNEAARMAYIEALEEISSLPTIKGWVARDEDGLLALYEERPIRRNREWMSSMNFFTLDHELFPDLKWEDEPIEVELPIIRK